MKTKSLSIVAALLAMTSLSGPAAFAHDGPHTDGITHQAPASATVSATPQGDGYIVAWTEPLDVSAIELYIGHGQRNGYVQRINVGAAKAIRVPANGVRFNLIATDGQFLHLECGGNDRTTMPTFTGVHVDCSYIDGSGHAAGALVIDQASPS